MTPPAPPIASAEIPAEFLDLADSPPVAALATVTPDGSPASGRHADESRAVTGKAPHRTLPYPPVQHQGVDWASIMRRQHTIHGMIELDVTETRRAIHRQRQASGEPLSFTALLVTSYAHVIGEDTSLQAYRKGKYRVVEFADVDVAVLVEHILNGERVPVPHIVRAANRKTPAEVDREIRNAQGDNDPYGRARRYAGLWLALPAMIRRFALTRLLANPQRRKKYTGTAAVTALSMFGKGTGWGVPFVSHSICLTVGGVGRRPGLGPDGKVEPRELVCLTISVDHDVVNGAPLARFISRFRKSVESAALLD
jgi:pyruvate/2-oxoglutarate dehydrogenase complex dihydrolipoamide acyltransferase (E2) component